MQLLLKQRILSWLDSFDVYNTDGSVAFQVKGRLAWGHKLEILDAQGSSVGLLQQELFTFLPRYAIYISGSYVGCVRKEFTFFRPVYTLDVSDWQVRGDLLGWDYSVTDGQGRSVMAISKQLFRWSDTYVLDIERPQDALLCLMTALAIDTANCSH